MFVTAGLFIFFLDNQKAALFIFLAALCMVAAIEFFCFRYFMAQQKLIENASLQITEYISGNHDARIQCHEEGEIYRLFHNVNTLVSILNAQAENEIQAKQFLKNTIGDISHQLKTPLTALKIYNEVLQDETCDPEVIQKFTKLSQQELDRIETLVQNLIKITKLDAGIILIEKKQENVAEMMESVQKHFAFRAEQEEKEICRTGDDTIGLLCDRSWIIESIDNLVKNALDHTEKGDKIEIIWKQFASIVQIVIKDNGCGIHPEDIHYIFKRFYRSKFSKDTPGIGLGLPLAKAIIEAHKGTIEVESELGMGTTFVINFLIPTKL